MSEPEAGESIFDRAGEIQQAAIVLERRKIAMIGAKEGSGRITDQDPGSMAMLAGFDLDFEEITAAIRVMGESFWDVVMRGVMGQVGDDYEDERHAAVEGAGSHWIEGMLVGMLIEQRRQRGESTPSIQQTFHQIDVVQEALRRAYTDEEQDERG